MGKALLALVLLLQAAADDKAAVDEAIKRFNKAYANPNPGARAGAVTELSSQPHDRTLKLILPLMSADVTQVRKAAAEAMLAFKDWKKIVIPSLQGAMPANAKEPVVQAAILTTLGKLQDPLALPTIHGNFREPNMKVTTAAVEACGLARQKESMDALLELQKDVQKWLKNKQSGPYRKDDGQQGDDNECKTRLDTIQKAIIKAFQDITKEKWATADEWDKWWTKKKANFEIPK
jgi:HEAT repeat protein